LYTALSAERVWVSHYVQPLSGCGSEIVKGKGEVGGATRHTGELALGAGHKRGELELGERVEDVFGLDGLFACEGDAVVCAA